MNRTEKFALVMSLDEKSALQKLAQEERISSAAIVRRLVYQAAKKRGLWPRRPAQHAAVGEVRDGR